MVINLKDALAHLPLPATATWPEGVWDKTVFVHGSMPVIVFAPRGHDYQTTHSQDELYVVMRGSGSLMIEERPHRFREGDVLFVPADTEHHFVDFALSISPGIWLPGQFSGGPQGGERETTSESHSST